MAMSVFQSVDEFPVLMQFNFRNAADVGMSTASSQYYYTFALAEFDPYPNHNCLLDDPWNLVDRNYPLVKRLHNYGQSPFLMGKLSISMAIFNSYVKLPKGVPQYIPLILRLLKNPFMATLRYFVKLWYKYYQSPI